MMERFSSLQRVICKGITLSLLLFLFVQPVFGLGIGASPDSIDFGVVSQKEGAEQDLYVINTGDEPEQVLIEVEEVDLKIDPDAFDLDAGETKTVLVSVDTQEAGTYNGSILITAISAVNAGDGPGIGAGVRIPVSFVVRNEMYGGIEVFTGFLVFVFAVTILWMRQVKHERKK